ncbi:hypothetical protein WJX79_000096 [Trebouxia sp. C0005]
MLTRKALRSLDSEPFLGLLVCAVALNADHLYQVSKSQEQDNIERTVASGRRAAPTPLRRPWRIARRLKQTSYSTEPSTQNRSYQPKGPNESTPSEQTPSNAGSQAPVGPYTEMNYCPYVVLYVGHVHIVSKHETLPPHTHA